MNGFAVTPEKSEGDRRDVPPARALAISLLALVAAMAGSWWGGSVATEGSGLVWVLALVPCFLLSYYRGWRGGTWALGLAMAAIVGAEVVAPTFVGESVDWWVVGGGTFGIVALSLGAGLTTELLHRSRGDPMLGARILTGGPELRRAMAREEFALVYQPIVSLPDGRVKGLEALIRWRHPERGLLRPDEFLPVAEASGLMADVDRWVLEEACHQAAAWDRSMQGRPPLAVHTNLFPGQFVASDLTGHLSSVLERTGLEPHRLSIEITERSVVEAPDRIHALAELGVRISVDDFGTGYSSLEYLRDFPVDALKIDRTFVEGMATPSADGAIIEAVLALGDALDAEVVAEGVTTSDQRAGLEEIGCPYGQGYLFLPPLLPDDLEPRLSGGPAPPPGDARRAASERSAAGVARPGRSSPAGSPR